MIIEFILDIVYNLFSFLTTPINIPDLPSAVNTAIEQLFYYMSSGAGLVAAYTPFSYMRSLFIVVIAVDVGISLYKVVMWILRKIPVLGVK